MRNLDIFEIKFQDRGEVNNGQTQPLRPRRTWPQIASDWQHQRAKYIQHVVRRINPTTSSAKAQAQFFTGLVIDSLGRELGYSPLDPHGLKLDQSTVRLVEQGVRKLLARWRALKRSPHNFHQLYQYAHLMLRKFGVSGLEDMEVEGCLRSLDVTARSRLNGLRTRTRASEKLAALVKCLVPSLQGHKNRPDNLSLRLDSQAIESALSQLSKKRFRNPNAKAIELREIFPRLSQEKAATIATNTDICSLKERVLAAMYRRPVGTVHRWLVEAVKDPRITPDPATQVVRVIAAGISGSSFKPPSKF